MARKNRLFAILAGNLDANGDITSEGLAADAAGSSLDVYDSISLLPMNGFAAGDQAFVKSTSRLYVNSGVGWYNVAVINNIPIISSVLDSDSGTTPFGLSTSGTATTITITATDSDGDTITYSATADSDFNNLGSVSNVDNVFTITPFSSDSATAQSGTITFAATDGINIASSGAQTFTLQFLSALWDETILSIGTSSTNSLDNDTFIDRSTSPHTISTTGTPIQTAFHPYLDQWSVEFDTSSSIVAPQITFGTSDFTIEGWHYLNSRTDTYPALFSNYTSFGAGALGLFAGHGSSTTTQYQVAWNGTFPAINAGTILYDQWVHYAVVRNSGTVTLYINGVSVGSFSGSQAINGVGSNVSVSYSADSATTSQLDGYISNFRVVNGTAVYTSAFTPPTAKLTAITNTALLTCQSNRIVDNSSNASTITYNGTPTVTTINPFGQGSEYAPAASKGATYFDGSSYLGLGTSTDFDFTGDFTVSCWIYQEASTGSGTQTSYQAILGGNGSGIVGWNFYITRSTGVLQWYYNSFPTQAAAYIKPKQWHHIAACRSGTDLHLYLDGTRYQTVSSYTGTISNNSATEIGRDVGGADVYFTGYISDVVIKNGTADYTGATYTLPTAPATSNAANTVLHLPMDNPGIFDKTGTHTLQLVNNTVTSTTQTKFADTAMYFDGNGDRIDIEDAKPLGAGDWTIEFWINPSSVAPQYQMPVDYRPGTTQGLYPTILLNYAKLGFYYSTGMRITGTTDLSTGTWYHVAVCKSGSSTKMFLNGTQEGSTLSDSNTYLGDSLFIGGNGFGAGFTVSGYLENVQILKGIAKYTTAFTPPSAEQGRQYQAED